MRSTKAAPAAALASFVGAILTTLLLTTGCATAPAPAPEPETELGAQVQQDTPTQQEAPVADDPDLDTDPAAPETGAATLSDRGHIVIEPGEPQAIYAAGQEAGTLTVNSIDPADTSASAFVWDDDATYLIVEVTLDLTNAQGEMGLVWQGVDAAGRVSESATVMPADLIPDDEQLPSFLDPGFTHTGSVVLELPEAHGSFIIRVYDGTTQLTDPYGFELNY